MIDEYARHNGQADLIRETVDGLTGKDTPALAESPAARELPVSFLTFQGLPAGDFH